MKISVLIPTINPKREYLQAALNSIPANVDELVLALGFETTIDGYALPPVKDIRQISFGIGVSMSESINIAVKECVTGDSFSILPDDDFYLEGISQIVDRVRESQADVVHFPMRHYARDNQLPGIFCKDKDVTFEQNLAENRINGSSFIRRSSFLWLDGYKGTICQDWDLFNRALKSGMKFEYVDIAGVALRFNGHSRLQKKAHEIGPEAIKREVLANTNAWDKKFYARCAAGMGLC